MKQSIRTRKSKWDQFCPNKHLEHLTWQNEAPPPRIPAGFPDLMFQGTRVVKSLSNDLSRSNNCRAMTRKDSNQMSCPRNVGFIALGAYSTVENKSKPPCSMSVLPILFDLFDWRTELWKPKLRGTGVLAWFQCQLDQGYERNVELGLNNHFTLHTLCRLWSFHIFSLCKLERFWKPKTWIYEFWNYSALSNSVHEVTLGWWREVTVMNSRSAAIFCKFCCTVFGILGWTHT